ncbi:MAG: tetratricopeptide repeat protein [Ignavibacteria bacterium]|nr:tetratricopeptide repeat protein [Ignavibacteria bacterium]
MNLDTLKDLLKQANEFNNSGNYKEAEKLSSSVLAELEHAIDSGEDQTLTERKTLRCSALNTLATTNYRRGDYQTALSLAHTSLDIAEEYELNQCKAKAWHIYGLVYKELGSYDKALEYYGKALAAHEELGEKSGAATVTGNIGNVFRKLGSYDKALEYYDKALAAHEDLGEKSGAAMVTGNIGIVFRKLGSYDKALEYYDKALAAHEELGEKSSVASVTGNIGAVYHFLGSYDKALEYFTKALAVHEELRSKSAAANVTGNIGIVYKSLGFFDKALEYYVKALAVHEELGEKSIAASVMGNIGFVYLNLGSYDKALEYYTKALAIHKENGVKSEVAVTTGYIGELYAEKKNDGYDAPKAEEFLLKSLAISTDTGERHHLFTVHKSLADLYENECRLADAYVHYKKYIEIRDELNLEETKKQDSIREQQKVIELAKAKADAKHQATEQLLHNVLPPSIANKMLDGTKLIAEKLPSVSVLFADIVNFTKLSQRITPEELVEGLDRIFSAFDVLAERHGLEKIKTIGDAYMVVSGAPIQREDHAESMANFALEMVEAMKEFRSISTGEEIQLRIGIHSGEVVAGVIGKKKFAYDLWGDAVNTASRMESHGEAGKIHVSEEFLKKLLMVKGEMVKEETDDFSSFTSNQLPFTIIPRGEMEIKGKGMMKTYFIERNNYDE